MESELIKTLRQLDPTGKEGFEGLVADLLEALTGHRFRLARSGSQAGRDLSARYANVVAVECKRYGSDTALNERELQGELVQAVMSMSDLDLWVLVTSREVPSQLHLALHSQAECRNVKFLSISLGDGEPSSLEALCAQSLETVVSYVAPEATPQQRERLVQSLEEIADHPNFTRVVDSLRDKFTSPLIGYDSWRSKQNQWFDSYLASERESRAHFGQPLNIRGTGAMLVCRQSAWAELDEWFSSWKDTHETFVVLGEEGDGKTWAVASWLSRNVQEEDSFPAVVFMSSAGVDSNEPLTLLSQVTSRRLRKLRTEDWAQRLARWTEESESSAPRVLLVLDGINERNRPTWWRELIERLAGSPWRVSVAVLITCRTEYWEKYFGALRHIETATYTLPPYDDGELDVALGYHDLSRSDISDELLPLIRKPRYFDLMVLHRERMAESGDVTSARLIYEDWRDRLQRKRFELDEDAFEALLTKLATRYLDGQQNLEERDIDALLPSYFKDKRAIIEELRTGGVLITEDGHLRVDESRLVYGFGLLLVDQMREAAATTDDPDWAEVIAEWLEPQAEMDIKAQICEFAAIHSLNLPGLPGEAKVALLNSWVSSHNPGEEAAENLVAYFPIDPSCYTDLAEVVWSDVSENPWAQELLVQSFLRWRGHPEITSQLRSAFERWLGFVHLYGSPYQRGETEEDAQKLRERICDRAGRDLEPGPFEFADRSLIAIDDDGLLRLGRAALAVISHIPREPFVQSIATGCVAEAIMGSPEKYDLFRWIMSTAPHSAWAEVNQEVKQLLEIDHIVIKRAAYRLLSFEGSENARELRNAFPDDLFPRSPLHRRYEEDPCTFGFPWRAEICEGCAQRDDLSPRRIARGLKRECRNPNLSIPDDLGTRLEPLVEDIDPDSVWSLIGPTRDDITLEEYEPCLCAYAPRTIANLVRRIVRQADQRDGMHLRQLAWHIKEHSLVLEEAEVDSIYRAWNRLSQAAPDWIKTQRDAEEFLFGPVLRELTARQQFTHLLERPDDTRDWTKWQSHFLPLNDWQVVREELGSRQSTKRRRRVFWFLSANPQTIPEDLILGELLPFLNHDDSIIRSSLFKIMHMIESKECIAALLGSQWSWDSSFCDRENRWGSLLLCEHGGSLSYSELRDRIHPVYLGYAVKCRGSRDEEVNRYAEDLDHIWSRIGIEVPDLPVDFPPVDIEAGEDVKSPTYRKLSSVTLSKSVTFRSRRYTWGGTSEEDPKKLFREWEMTDEQRAKMAKTAQQAVEEQVEAGNVWFAQRFRPHTLERVLERRRDLASKWVDFALADSSDSISRIRRARSFYDSLCAMLLKQEPSTGIRLYERLVEVDGGVTVRDSQSKIPLLDYALFEAPSMDIVYPAWKSRLETCTTDKDLMRVTIVAQLGNGQDWLQSYINQRIASSAPLERSRAFTLMGFVETQGTFDRLVQLADTEPDTWVGNLLEKSLDRWQTNAWAKHWFERFLTTGDDTNAWAAFRLFLHCVDGRFWLWQREARASAEDRRQLARRIAFLKDNSHTIENRIRKNEKPLSKHLFGQKAMADQVWPWMSLGEVSGQNTS